ncbi:MAG: TylF/MycF/NovP-related O-methyltransferase [Candidatus Omnitrophota bacterium]|nr:TylF/MycF/NovP-related O-methyltransferase [Candidatus Omnitrophota bacterium]
MRVPPRGASSAAGGANVNIILELLQQTVKIDGDIAECGVYRGHTLVPMGTYIKQQAIKKHIYGLDSFEGFDETVNIDIALGGSHYSLKREKGFDDTSYDLVQDKMEYFNLESIVTLIPGFFERTLSEIKDVRFSFVHLDVDLYQSYKACLEFFYPRMSTQGIILIDEYDDPPWPGCNKAVDEFLADKPEKPIQIERKSFIKSYVIKK